MAHSEKCPVCNGKGKTVMLVGNIVDTANNLTENNPKYEIPCHGCNGKGWIVVSDNVTYLEYAR